eukprot:6210579-Pleurochrysis_carterae.AAC.2
MVCKNVLSQMWSFAVDHARCVLRRVADECRDSSCKMSGSSGKSVAKTQSARTIERTFQKETDSSELFHDV